MLIMLTRLLKKPTISFFLFGPRATGKSTWIKQHFPDAIYYDLLNTREKLRLSRDPGLLFRETETQPPGTWVVIDEVQKVPGLLDEVHRLMESRSIHFVLSGSSARKLRHGASNLLAGRAIVQHLFPLVSVETDFEMTVSDTLRYGTLPLAITGGDPVAYLSAYADTYLQEEIMAEALTRNIGNFSRFLEIAARQNGQITNVSSIARDAAVSRQTVQNYFEVLVDTLIGSWLHPWKLKRSTKQVAHPKFYLFDCGIVRALSGRLPYPPAPEEEGHLLETFLFNEIRAYISYERLHYPLYFWCSYDGVEVDLLCETGQGFLALEIKAASRWDKQYNRGLNRIRSELGPQNVTCYGIYQGERQLTWNTITVMPVHSFLQHLWNGDIMRPRESRDG